MNQTTIILRDHPEWKDRAATWFHKKWGIPEEAYLESMEECLNKQNGVPSGTSWRTRAVFWRV